jgi:manganese transport protein
MTRAESVESARVRAQRALRGVGPLRLLPFLGPAFIASIAYIDPGNFATNIAGGSRYGYTLVWVIVASSLFIYGR